MKHFNKQLEINHSVFKSKARIERINILILIMLGVFGVYYAMKVVKVDNTPNYTSPLTTNMVFGDSQTNQTNEALQTSVEEVKNKENMLVSGRKEAGETLQVTINAFDEKAKYTIIWGNGQFSDIKNKETQYTYQTPGEYEIQLLVSYPDQPVHTIQKSIKIENAVARSAEGNN